ncbi:MAG: MaoC family dehydratase [Alphaproteobacteria bacterium]
MANTGKLTELRARVGEEIAVSPWFTVDQDHIDQFARATHDLDWMHIDPERAKAESPFKSTIAFGFQTLSMLSYFTHEAGLWPDDTAFGINYGLNRVRFMAPVREGKRIRARFTLKSCENRPDGAIQGVYEAVVEIEDEAKPAMVAEWIGLFYPADANPSDTPSDTAAA